MQSEISLIHPDDINWFLTCDETHHAFSNEGYKGGSTAQRYSTSSFHRSGERCVASNSHTTGVYGTTGAGYPMPCMFVMSSNAKEATDFQIDPAVCVGLPVVRAKYADNVLTSDYPSHVAVRHSGSVDTYLWHELNRAVYIPCFAGKISVEPVRDPITKKLISGPIVCKTDGGPGRLSKEAESIDFREEMAAMGVHILLSLPNGTAATAEMDQLYSKFKPRCKDSTIRVAGVKMAIRLAARKKHAEEKKKQAGERVDSMEESSESDSETPRKKKGRRSACNVSIGNRDLANIVNGFPGDELVNKPFDYTFTRQNIINSWIAVGFLPMTANAVNDPKVRFELGEGGAPEAEQKRISDLYTDYCTTRDDLGNMEFNAELLDLEPNHVENHVLPANEEEAIQALMKNGGVNKAGSLFRVGISVVNCRVVLETLRRTKEQQEKEKEEKERARKVAEDGKLNSGLEAFGKWCGDGSKVDDHNHPIMSRMSALAIVKVLMPKVAPTLKLSDYTTLKTCTKWLGELAGGTTWVDEMKAMEEGNELNPTAH